MSFQCHILEKKGPYLIWDTLNITCTVELCTMQPGTFVKKKKDKRSAFWFLVDFKVICTYFAPDFIVWGLDLMTVLVYRVKSDLVSSTFYQNGCEEIDKCVHPSNFPQISVKPEETTEENNSHVLACNFSHCFYCNYVFISDHLVHFCVLKSIIQKI